MNTHRKNQTRLTSCNINKLEYKQKGRLNETEFTKL